MAHHHCPFSSYKHQKQLQPISTKGGTDRSGRAAPEQKSRQTAGRVITVLPVLPWKEAGNGEDHTQYTGNDCSDCDRGD